MPPKADTLVQRIAHKRALERWREQAKTADALDLSSLRLLQKRAQDLREPMNRIVKTADIRLTRPRADSQSIVNKPQGTDWAWRPQAWCNPLHPVGKAGMRSGDRVGDQIAIFHDCSLCELTLRQLRNRFDEDLSAFGLRLEALGFGGSFLSLALDLPADAFRGITQNHVFRLSAMAASERKMEFFARLNIRNGPNTAQAVSELPIPESGRTKEALAEFDLAYVSFNPKRVQQIWVDLIFEGVAMNQVTLRDVTLTRHLRAEL